MNEETNQKIFNWLNPQGCWHEKAGPMGPTTCKHCEEPWPTVCNLNPDFCSPTGFFTLLEGLRGKGYAISLEADSVKSVAEVYTAFTRVAGQSFAVIDPDLPTALALATVQLIESEER